MRLWLDNQLSPALVAWLTSTFGFDVTHVRDIGLARAGDREIFAAASARADAIMTKDKDFAELVARLGPPPAVILISRGNSSTSALIELLRAPLSDAADRVASGEALVVIGDT